MPKKHGKHSGSSRGDSQILHWKFAPNGVFVSGVVSVPVAPVAALSPRATQEADAWALYRVKRLRFRLRRISVPTALQVAGFIPGVTDSVTNVSGLSEVIPRTILASTDTVPSDWATVPRGDLVGYQPWYKTVAGSPDGNVEVMGSLFIIGTGAEAYAIEMEGTFEFRDGVATTSTPFPMAHQALVDTKREAFYRKERARLLGLLSSIPTPDQSGLSSNSLRP